MKGIDRKSLDWMLYGEFEGEDRKLRPDFLAYHIIGYNPVGAYARRQSLELVL